ncbi:eukaryotic translation initiation factor 2-alpha kinase-like [Sabethes cyaneus]|uniref:eukaryotic translation initiation factor 2-alpha kinase-like n=1 Tax=Sabethes cyaneus TaxID=53552 RepID=UPI00221E2946|nr:eukaryotic translation initiation factor 2-alpha kinase-like [Sabethes cyaneus]
MATFSTLIGPLLLLLVGTILLGGSIPVRADTVVDTTADEPPQPIVEKLPFCDEDVQSDRDISDRLLYVTTLDGRLSALDLTNGGALQWSVETGPGPLLSSSIHRLELTNNGKWVRMIPSLNGGLYKFDGETVEPIPFSAEDLLKSSFKFSDDLVISGGKETRSYGISSRTGQIIYECTMSGCRNSTEIMQDDAGKNGPMEEVLPHDPLQDDVVVIRRQTQTVRAVESRTGNERWNFSIGHHELEMLKNEDCRGGSLDTSLDPKILDLELKVIIPDGVVCAVSRSTPGKILWKYTFDHPVVSAWRAKDKNDIMSVNLFHGADWIWNGNQKQQQQPQGQDKSAPTGAEFRQNSMINPSLYLGMHQKQLYIQESGTLLARRQPVDVQTILVNDDTKYPMIPWKPYPARPEVAGYITDGSEKAETEDSEYAESTAIARSVLYQSAYVNGDGFFLYTPEDLKQKDNGLCSNSTDSPEAGGLRNQSSIFDFTMDPDAPVKIIIISIWFWWKEILIISATTAFLLNVILRFKNEKEVVVFVERQVEVPVPIALEATEDNITPLAALRGVRSLSESNGDNFVSRFQEDFELVQCLGKGGFGVVFEVRNKLDDCNYAIKRVVLPNRQESKDRVMREVKTLAHCEHNNIVRYFHAWTETPPPGWQENQDKIWIQRNCLSTSIDIESPTETSPPNSNLIPTINSNFSQSIKQKYNKSRHSSLGQPMPWLSKVPEPSFSGSRVEDDQSDSFIEFRADHARSESNDSSFQIEFKHDSQAAADSVNIAVNDSSLSASSHVVSIEEPTVSSISRPIKPEVDPRILKKRHRRHLSLDLTSTGSVVRPSPTTESNHMMDPSSSNATGTSNVSNKIYLYIQMQLCRKQSLKEWLAENDLSARQDRTISIFEQIVNAVEYVHLKGLIHRDLKPSNIFFSLDGRVKIGDFGLVTDSSDLQYDNDNNLPGMTMLMTNAAGHRQRHTRQVGTQLYMSPEQLKGQQYDYKVDIYSLGLILFELLVSFGTEMERIDTMKNVRKNKFPDGFQEQYSDEYQLLKLMLAEKPNHRPTTFGIKARPPLKRMPASRSTPQLHSQSSAEDPPLLVGAGNSPSSDSSDHSEWHFELPPRRKDSRSVNTTTSSSNNSEQNQNQIFF